MRRLAFSALVLGLAGLGWACGSTMDTGDPCPDGICTDGGTGGNGGGGGGSGGAGSGGTGGAGCQEAWGCTPFETNGKDDKGSRSCVDTNKCGTSKNKPVETATLPALDFDYFKCKVGPIFSRGCAMADCHGNDRALRYYNRGGWRNTAESVPPETGCLQKPTDPPIPLSKCVGSIECSCWTKPKTATEWRRNFDSARSFGLDRSGTPIPAGMEDKSELLSQATVGGLPHIGIKLFPTGDPDAATLRSWLAGAKLGSACNTMD